MISVKRMAPPVVAALLAGALTLVPAAAESGSRHRQGTRSGNLGTWLVSLFRDHISAVDGDRCPSLPSCAQYSIEAFSKHGFFVGWIMTVDRLIHEGSEESSVSPLIYDARGRLRIHDPVENNDFWWSRPRSSE